MKTHLKGGGEDMWVIHFDQGPVDSLEMRKLPAVMPEMNVSVAPNQTWKNSKQTGPAEGERAGGFSPPSF